MKRTLIILASLGSLSGCALSSQGYEDLRATAYRTTPQLHQRPKGEPFDVALPSTTKSDPFEGKKNLDLNDLIAEVEHRNPSLSAKLQSLRAAINRYPQVTSLQDPMLSYSIAPGTIGQGGLDFGHKIEMSFHLPWPGKRTLRGEMALNEAEAARWNLETLRQQLVRLTRTEYFNYYYIHRAIEINEINKSLLERFRGIADVKYRAGTASKQDTLQAEVEYNHLLHRGIVLERRRKNAVGRINALLNRMPDETLPPPPTSLPDMPGRPDVAKLRALAINRHPELVALAARVRGREAAVGLARKDYYPDITVMGTYSTMWTREEHRGMIGFGLNIPLGRDQRRAAVNEAQARVGEFKMDLAAAVTRVSREVQEAYDRLVESEHVVHLFRTKLIPAVQENLDAARSGYESGKNDFLTLITADKHLMQNRLENQKAIAEYHIRLADLERAVGSSFAGLETEKEQRP